MEYTKLEVEYSPSRWSKRYPAEKVISNHVKFAIETSDVNKRKIPCDLSVPYGKEVKQKYDIFGTDLPGDSSIFIYIHGGYWQELDRDYSSYVVEPFYNNKIKSIVIGYTLCPKVTVFEIVKEIELALTACLEYAKKCGSKGIYISGYSAGSQLIACLSARYFPNLPQVDKNLIKAMILCCGVYDLVPLVNTYINGPLNLTYDTAKELSPIYQDITKFEYAIYIVVGENDSPAFKEQSKLYYKKIKSLGDVRFKILDVVDHFSIVEKYSCDDYELVKFIVDMNTK